MKKRKRGGGTSAIGRELGGGREDPEIAKLSLPRPAWPDIVLPRKRVFSTFEKDCVNYFVDFRQQMKDGPLYTFVDPSSTFQKSARQGPAHSQPHSQTRRPRISDNPFEAMPTYQRKYNKPKRSLPLLSKRHFVTKWFPEELKSIIDPTLKSAVLKPLKKKKSHVSDAGDDGSGSDSGEGEDAEKAEQEEDEAYDDDDDEFDGDDYNAEQYFDNGEDDAIEDEDGGAGGGEDADYD